MKHLLLASLLCAWVLPAFAAPKNKLPPSIRAMTPQKIVSLRVFRVAPAPKAPQLLLHLWTVPKRDFERREKNGYGSDVDSPFVLDVFTDEKRPRFRTSLILATNHTPTKVRLWYLNAKTKEGLVFEVIDDSRATESYYRDKTTFFVLPYWDGTFQTSQTFQTFAGSGANNSYFAQRGINGEFQIIHSINLQGGSFPFTGVLTWDREEERFILTEYTEYPSRQRMTWNRERKQFEAKQKASPK